MGHLSKTSKYYKFTIDLTSIKVRIVARSDPIMDDP
jgi:hypothetical protein